MSAKCLCYLLTCFWVLVKSLFLKFYMADFSCTMYVCKCAKKPLQNLLSPNLLPLTPQNLLVYVLLGGLKDVPPTDYNYLQNSHRLASFRYWPPNNTMSAIRLAENGFFFINSVWPYNNDSVMCHACFATISDWQRESDVLQRHRDSSPNCPFLRSHSGRTDSSHERDAHSVRNIINPNNSLQTGHIQPSCSLMEGNNSQTTNLFMPSNNAQHSNLVQESMFQLARSFSSDQNTDVVQASNIQQSTLVTSGSSQPSSSFTRAEQASGDLDQTISTRNDSTSVTPLPLDTMINNSSEINVVSSLICQETDTDTSSRPTDSLCTSKSHYNRFDDHAEG